MPWNDERLRKRFEFACPVKWEDMDATENPQQRFCQQCNKHVTEVSSEAQFNLIASQGGCASVVLASGAGLVAAPEPPEDADRLGGAPKPPKEDMPGEYPSEYLDEPPEQLQRTTGTIVPDRRRLTGPARPAWFNYLVYLILLSAIAGVGYGVYWLWLS